MEKPKILSEKQIGDLLDLEEEYVYYCSDGSRKHTLNCWPVVKAQLDADVAHYEPLIQQAKAEVAGEIVDKFIEEGVGAMLDGERWWEEMKSKWGQK